MADRDVQPGLGALGGGGAPTFSTVDALRELLISAQSAQEEAYREGAPKGIAKDAALGLASILTGLGSTLEQGGPSELVMYGLPQPGETAGPLTALDQAVWAGMSPAAKAASFLGVPDEVLAGLPLAFIRAGKGTGMGKGVIADLFRGSLQKKGTTPRLTPVERHGKAAGSFNPLHAGTRESALERLGILSPTRGEYTISEFDLPVRGTLGTFERPLDDPTGNWVEDAATAAALRKLGVDAVLYRNAVEGTNSVSLEALAPLVQRGESSTVTRPFAAAQDEKLAGHQMYLPGVGQQSGEVKPGYTIRPYEAAQQLDLQHPRMSGNPRAEQGWSWDDVWAAVRAKAASMK